LISQLDHRHVREVEDTITSPPDPDPYTTLTTQFVMRLPPRKNNASPSSIRSRRWVTVSQFWRHPRSLPSDVPHDFLLSICTSRLLSNIQAILAGQCEGSLDAAARCVDRISEAAPQPALVRVGSPTTALHFCRESRTSPSRWQHSEPSRTAFAPASGTLATAEMICFRTLMAAEMLSWRHGGHVAWKLYWVAKACLKP
jgi:hypothetical protein